MNKKILSREALLFNLNYFFSFAPQVCAVVKADAYGHGIKDVVEILQDKPSYYGVANVDEAEKIVDVCPNARVIILDRVSDFSLAQKYYLTAVSLADVRKAIRLNVSQRCFIKICSGMNRFGINCKDEKKMATLKELIAGHEFAGISGHFSSPTNCRVSKREYLDFLQARQFLDKNFLVNFGGSGAKNFPCDILRVGIGLYGYGDKNLKKVMRLNSQILQIRSLEKGEKAGYDGKFKAKRRTTLAIVGVGYGDGFDRNSSKKIKVKIDGKVFNAVGIMCMDCCFVDVTGGNVKVGNEVEMFDDAVAMAKWSKKSTYEILTNFSLFRGKTIKS